MVSRALSASLAVILAGLAAPLGAQPVLLQIRPHVGDTLHVRLDQQVEMTGMPPGCESQVTSAQAHGKNIVGSCSEIRTMNTTMEVFSRAIARNATRDATEMLAITDSVRTTSGKSGAGQRIVNQPMSKAPVEIRVSTDGLVELGAGPASDEIRTLFGQMPATLSRKPVAIGEKWVHEMRVPLPREPGATARVRTTFQLDSLGRNSDVAYISMRGTLTHDHSDGSDSETGGSLTGTMRFDRRLAWITDTHATIDVWSLVKSESAGRPMRVHTTVIQNLKVSGAR